MNAWPSWIDTCHQHILLVIVYNLVSSAPILWMSLCTWTSIMHTNFITVTHRNPLKRWKYCQNVKFPHFGGNNPIPLKWAKNWHKSWKTTPSNCNTNRLCFTQILPVTTTHTHSHCRKEIWPTLTDTRKRSNTATLRKSVSVENSNFSFKSAIQETIRCRSCKKLEST